MENQGFSPDEGNGRVFAITRYTSEKNIVSSENLVRINSRGTFIKNSSFFKKLSFVLCLLFLIAIAALLTLVYLYIRPVKQIKICNTSECLRSAANMKLSMDPTVDPCDNFYSFTCGRWSEEHPNHGWYPRFTTFETIEEKVELRILDFLQKNSTESDPLPVRQSRDFFKSCTNVEAIDRKGYSSTLKYLRAANLSTMPQFFNNTKSRSFSFDWLRADVAIKKLFYMDIFVGVTVDSNVYDNSNNSLYLGTPGHDCPLPKPFMGRRIVSISSVENKTKNEDVDEDENKEILDAHQRIFKFVVRNIFANQSMEIPKNAILDQAYEIMYNMSEDFDDFLGNYTVANNEIDEYSLSEFTLNEIQNITDEYLIQNGEKPIPIWIKYFTYLYEGVNSTITFDGTETVFVDRNELWYLPKIVYYLLKLPDEHLELYMWWVTLYAMIINTTSEMVEYISKQTAPFISNTLTRSRSMECADLVKNFMGMAVSYGVADRSFLNQTKPKVQEMVHEIKRAFVDRVNQLNWMDFKTKQATLMKARYMVSFIGYPEWLYEPGGLERYYNGITIRNDSYLDNMMEFVQNYMPYKLEMIGTENMRTWRTDPVTVNAYNYFSDNAINVPMAILSFPVYNLGLEVLNYGAIGTILGHELTHGFDNFGRKFDAYGNFHQWWSNKTIETFENYTECFVKQYSNYSVESVEGQVDGERTLAENLADNGGLHHAYRAYKRFIARHGPEPTLPGFEDYTSEQLFFIAFGNMWCEASTAEALKEQLDGDDHCPNVVRVLGTLQNSFEFAAAFQCPVGSNMNPNRKRCRIW